jgi:hypothetical protein
MRFPGRHSKYTHVIIDDAILIGLANSWNLYRASNGSKYILKKDWANLIAEELMKLIE